MDFQILYALQGIHTPLLDKVMVFFTNLGDAGALWIVIGLLCLARKKTRRLGVAIAIALLLTLFVGEIGIKNLVARSRPCWIDPSVPLLIRVPKDYSFPSGHTATAFSAAFCILATSKKWGVVALVVAALIAFSRLYLFVHFPTDVLGGILVAAVYAVVAVKASRRWLPS